MEKVIVIGNGMVGYKFCEKLRAKATDREISLTVYGEEPLPAYDRVHLSEYFESQSEDKLLMAPRSWYEEHAINLKTSQFLPGFTYSSHVTQTNQSKSSIPVT